MKTKQITLIEVSDWDFLVEDTYNRPYSFQQQDDCKERQLVTLVVPATPDDYENDTVPEIVNHPEMGVSFKAWLKRDPNQPLESDPNNKYSWSISMWWERNFYPNVQMIANDLHQKGLLPAGKYSINIDW